MVWMRAPLVVVFLCIFLFSGLGLGQPLTLKEALNFAFEHSPVFDGVRRSQSVADLQQRVAFAGFLPSLDFQTSDGLVGNHPPGTTDPYSTSLSLTLTENLYDNGASWTNYKLTRDNLQIADLTLLKARDKLCLDVANLFYQYSLNVKVLEIKKEQLATLDKQLALVNSQYQQGFKTKKDFLRLKAQVQRAQIDIVNATNDIESSSNDLRRLLGVSSEGNLPVTFSPVEPGLKDLEVPQGRLAAQEFYDFKISKIQSEANELNVDLQRRNYWPQFNLKLGGTYSHSAFFGPTSNTTSSGTIFAPLNTPSGTLPGAEAYGWSALFTISYNILDWGILRQKVEIAENTKIIQDDAIKDSLLSVGNEIRGTELQLQRLVDSYRLEKELLQSTSQSYEILRADYREGKIAYLDMITSFNDLLAAKVSYFTTYFNLLQNIARSHFYEGNLYEKILGQ